MFGRSPHPAHDARIAHRGVSPRTKELLPQGPCEVAVLREVLDHLHRLRQSGVAVGLWGGRRAQRPKGTATTHVPKHRNGGGPGAHPIRVHPVAHRSVEGKRVDGSGGGYS